MSADYTNIWVLASGNRLVWIPDDGKARPLAASRSNRLSAGIVMAGRHWTVDPLVRPAGAAAPEGNGVRHFGHRGPPPARDRDALRSQFTRSRKKGSLAQAHDRRWNRRRPRRPTNPGGRRGARRRCAPLIGMLAASLLLVWPMSSVSLPTRQHPVV